MEIINYIFAFLLVLLLVFLFIGAFINCLLPLFEIKKREDDKFAQTFRELRRK